MNNNQLVKDLTLLLLWLTSWEERDEIVRSWKGYDFGILDELAKDGSISDSHRAKSCYLTEEGIKKAKAFKEKYIL